MQTTRPSRVRSLPILSPNPTHSSNKKKGKVMRFKMGKRQLIRTAGFFRKSGMASLIYLWRRCEVQVRLD
jgi:hypothetical protein